MRPVRILALFLSMLILTSPAVLPRDVMVISLILISSSLIVIRKLNVIEELIVLIQLPIAVAILTLFQDYETDALSIWSRFFNFLSAILLLLVYSRERKGQLQNDFLIIMFLISVQGLITVGIAAIGKGYFVLVPDPVRPYYLFGYIFAYQMESFGVFVRPNGPFFEPGVFQMFLNLYLYVALFEKRKKGHSILALSAILCTYSTTGAFIALLQLAYYFTRAENGRVVLTAERMIGGFVVVIPAIYYFIINAQDKVSGNFEGSYLARYSDFFTSINIILDHPLVGIGFSKEAFFSAAAENRFFSLGLPPDWLATQSATNGLLSQIYSLGVPLSIPFFVGLLRQKIFVHTNVVAAIIIISLMTEKIFMCPFVLVVCFSGLIKMKNRTSSDNETPATRSLALTPGMGAKSGA